MSHPCSAPTEPAKLVVVTGGPGAGKTALLEVLQRDLCEHVHVLPEAASILWRGGFPRRATGPARKAAQRSIARVQLDLERLTVEENHASLILCDRGTLDGLAYWPDDANEYFRETGLDRDRELARYAAVLQLQPAPAEHGYQRTALRPETAEEARAIDVRIREAWAGHPNVIHIESDANFLAKLERAVTKIHELLPSCCRSRGHAALAHLRALRAAAA